MLLALNTDDVEVQASLELEGSSIRLTIQKGSELPKVKKVTFDQFLWQLTRTVPADAIVKCISDITEDLPSY